MKTNSYILIGIIMLMLIPMINPASSPNTIIKKLANYDEYIYPNGQTKMVIGVQNYLDKSTGKYIGYDYNAETKFYDNGNSLIIEWKNKKVELQYYIVDNFDIKKTINTLTLKEKTDLNLKTNIKQVDGFIRTYEHTLSKDNKPKSFGYNIIKTNVDCYVKNKDLICEEQKISFNDAANKQHLKVDLTKDDIKISEQQYIIYEYSNATGKPVKTPKTLTSDLSYIDPTLSIQGITVTMCGYNDSYDVIEINNTGILQICDGGNGILTNGTLELVVVNLTVWAGGLINGTGVGYRGTTGPGAGGTATDGAGGGGGYGGKGGPGNTAPPSGALGGITYGSLTNVTSMGSGGGNGIVPPLLGGAGGGYLKVIASDTINITGVINMTGANGGSSHGGGGSGGGIWFITKNITGTGILGANGAGGGGGGGGGGRVLIQHCANSSSSLTYSLKGKQGYSLGEDGNYSMIQNTSLCSGVDAQFNSPINYYNTTDNTPNLACDFWAFGTTNISNVTIKVYDTEINLDYTNTQTNILLKSYSKTWTTSALSDGKYNWSCWITGDDNLQDNTDNRTLTIDITKPNILIIYPNQTFNYSSFNANISLNWTVSDANLEKCWFNYNNTNTTVPCLNLNYTFILTNQRNITLYANDSMGNINSSFASWGYRLFENSQTYNTTTSEGSYESFVLNMSTISNLLINSANLIYNGISYTGSVYSYGSGNYLISKSITVPDITSTTNFTFYWNITLNDGMTISSINHNQTVNNLTVDNCAINSIVLLNFTLKDEAEQTLPSGVNSSIEVEVNIYPVGSTTSIINYSKLYSNVSYATVCISNINNSNYKMDALVRYVYQDHEPEFYNIQKYNLKNTTLYQNITLYDLLTTDSIQFLITYKDQTFVPISNALINIQRKYVSEGVFKTVEIPKTDSYGQTTGHFDTDGVLYNIIVSKDGIVLGTFNNVAVLCNDKVIGDCKINLNPNVDTGTFTDFQQKDNLIYTMSFNQTTRTISSSFSTVDGSSANMVLNAIKFDTFGNVTVCSNSLTGSSGNVNCVIPTSYGNLTVLATLYKDGGLITQETYTIYPNQADTFGNDGYILVIILLITIPLMFISSPVWTAIGIIMGVGIGGMLLLFKSGSFLGTGSVLIWLIIAIGIILWKISKRGENV